MSDLSNLPRPDGAHRPAKRVGRGPGSGTGKTAGRGHKGQKARTGHHGIPAWFEGGQMPLQRRLPKRGFTNRSRVEFEVVNVGDLARVDGTDITPETLSAHRLVDADRGPVKLLGNGDTDRKLSVRVHAISASARQKIEAAGGSVELIERAAARTDAADETQTAGDETPAADTGADASGNADDAAEK